MNEAKIRLSPKEQELVLNADIILTKNAVMEKAKLLLQELQSEQETILQKLATPGSILLKRPPKISRGENYLGLPYLVLDYPRLLDQTDMLAIRTMFWWGNFFSVTILLSGHYKQSMEAVLLPAYDELIENGYYWCTGNDPWHHHFEESNYRPLKEWDREEFQNLLHGNRFIKLAVKTGLNNWDNAPVFLSAHFSRLATWLVSVTEPME